jgi:hypothetical protein
MDIDPGFRADLGFMGQVGYDKSLLGGYVNVGEMLDLTAAKTGRRTLLELWGNTDIGRGLTLNWDVSRQWMRRDGGTAFEASLVNAGGSWQFNPRQRLRLTLQGSEVLRDQSLYVDAVNATARDWAAQLVYSYKVNPHTALYAGGSYGAFMDDANPDLFGDTRSVFAKFTYGWQP